MSTKSKGALSLFAIILALALVGHLDAQDAQCSWNGCGIDRFIEE